RLARYDCINIGNSTGLHELSALVQLCNGSICRTEQGYEEREWAEQALDGTHTNTYHSIAHRATNVAVVARLMLPTSYALFHNPRLHRARSRFHAAEIATKLCRSQQLAAKGGSNTYAATRQRAQLGEEC